jgi:hypothetical protein
MSCQIYYFQTQSSTESMIFLTLKNLGLYDYSDMSEIFYSNNTHTHTHTHTHTYIYIYEQEIHDLHFNLFSSKKISLMGYKKEA